ncbi:probable secreted glycoprotein [Natronomonas moolapensis 8.8.11]|uniref:Probable secreted glycoprotein n=1 Tax=Natronomonas moolapensis (strain DSM 18674 / CECT 7526 / JCM 14361 / 8.8.11) TaxID=268739 RepID=M1XRE0_NATM8|nr:PKD domain-containing protein [Natronomonas moolapensis]CCQ36766.1 probable secreted glycoprotein [Natronomonas moolapensis 8.8.11]
MIAKILQIIGGITILSAVAAGGVLVAAPGMVPTVTDSPNDSAEIRIVDNQWGEVTEESIEVQSEAQITNPATTFQSEVSADISMNGYQMVSTTTSEETIEQGTSTATIESQISREDIPEWWVSHIENGEESEMKVELSGDFSKGDLNVSPSTEQNRRFQTDIRESIRMQLKGFEGDKAGYLITVNNTNAEWGTVNQQQTEIILKVPVRNNHPTEEIPVTDFSGSLRLNEILLLDWESEQNSYIIQPGETQTIEIRAYIDNQDIDDWLATHIKNGESSDYEIELSLSIGPLGDKSSLAVCSGRLNTTLLSENIPGPTRDGCELQRPEIVDSFDTGSFELRENPVIKLRDEKIISGEDIDSGGVLPNDGDNLPNGGDNLPGSEEEGDESSDENTPGPNESPDAIANADQLSGTAPLTVTLDAGESSDPDGAIEEYRWSVEGPTPDGRSEEVTRQFQTAGEYNIELSVVDDDGAEDTDTLTVTVEAADNPPEAVAEASPTSGEAPLNVDFDASGSNDPDGDIAEYVWRFDDLSSPERGEDVSHEFDDPGRYDVQLRVVDQRGNEDTDTVTITVNAPDNPPEAVAEASPTSGKVPLEVDFDASESSDPDDDVARYRWEFDDGRGPRFGEEATRTFTDPGTYDVELTVTDEQDNTDTDTVEIEVESNEPPNAVAEANPSSGEAPLDVTFDASRSSDPDGEIERYTWQIEGATPGGQGETIERTFRTRGEYEATLIVVDDNGARDRTSVTVDVEGRFQANQETVDLDPTLELTEASFQNRSTMSSAQIPRSPLQRDDSIVRWGSSEMLSLPSASRVKQLAGDS